MAHPGPLAQGDLVPTEPRRRVHQTPAFQAFGFHCGTDFLLLAERLGVVASRAERLLAHHLDAETHQQVDGLIGRSFLSPETQERYRAVVSGRRRALSQSG